MSDTHFEICHELGSDVFYIPSILNLEVSDNIRQEIKECLQIQKNRIGTKS